jgi:hypothetical protein
MERCPAEILHNILAMACNDGGYTARSVSQVSRTIREKARYSLFHSISCRNSDQVLSFGQMLDDTPPHLRVVRHLCLIVLYKHPDGGEDIVMSGKSARSASFSTPSSSARPLNYRLDRTPAFMEEEVNDEEDNKQFDHLDRVLHRAIIRILSILAPSLYTLSLYIDCRSWLFFPFPPSFPLLTELSIKHPFKSGVFRSDALIALKTCRSLRKLVLTGFKTIFDPPDVIDRINTFGPNVTHLCLQAYFHTAMIYSLIHRMKVSSSGNIPLTSTSRTFPQSLECLFFHFLDDEYILPPRVLPIFPGGQLIVYGVKRVWGYVPTDEGKGSETHLAWESMWVDGINGKGGFWMYP